MSRNNNNNNNNQPPLMDLIDVFLMKVKRGKIAEISQYSQNLNDELIKLDIDHRTFLNNLNNKQVTPSRKVMTDDQNESEFKEKSVESMTKEDWIKEL